MSVIYNNGNPSDQYWTPPTQKTNYTYKIEFETDKESIPASNVPYMSYPTNAMYIQSTTYGIYILLFKDNGISYGYKMFANLSAISLPIEIGDSVSGILDDITLSNVNAISSNNLSVAYVIEKTGSNSYQMNYRIEETHSGIQQIRHLNIQNEDSDGTIRTEAKDVGLSSIASFSMTAAQLSNNASSIEYQNDVPFMLDFPINVDSTNLQPGGTYFRIESISNDAS